MLRKVFAVSLVVFIFSIPIILGVMSFKKVDPYTVLGAFSRDSINLVIEDSPIETNSSPIIQEDKVLIPVDLFKEHIYDDVELSEKYNRLYVNIKNPDFNLEDDSLTTRLKEGINLNFLTEKINDINYINLTGLEKLFSIEVNYIKDFNILTIDKSIENVTYGVISDDTNLRPEESYFSFTMDKLKEGEKVKVFKNGEDWIKVRTNKGFIGYVLSKKVDVETTDLDVDKKLNIIREDYNPDGKINLVWDHINKYSPDLSLEDKIEGLDVISPTWFSIVSGNGYVINNGDIEYVRDAHDKGYKVWGLITNNFDKDLTKKLLADEKAQENAINQILLYSSIYNLDGINIDFENVYYEDKDNLTAFVDKLTSILKKQNLVVSMDMTIPSASPTWSKFYDREKLGKIIDYAMVMTYDEHWSSSPKSGSVASIDWVDMGIERTLKYIPKEKLLMGIPFYTREWEEYRDDNGKIKVKSRALSMKKVEEIIKENNSDIIWLEDIGQYYTEYNIDKSRYRIWIEDEKSIELKANLVFKHDLKGAASWRKGFEKKEVWNVLYKVLKRN